MPYRMSKTARRREKRAHLQSDVAKSADVLHRPTLSRAQIQAKGKHETPKRIEDAKPIKFMVQDAFWQLEEYKRNLERAAIVYANEFGRKQGVSGAVCLPEVAIFAAGHRKSKQVTAR